MMMLIAYESHVNIQYATGREEPVSVRSDDGQQPQRSVLDADYQ